jgi:DNA sulfur modification protein DndB
MKNQRPIPSKLLSSNKPVGSITSYPALALVQNGQKFYFATIPKEDVFPFCYVAGRDEDPREGFQRSLDYNRARDIARYLDDSIGSIPTNVVLSAQPDAELEYNSKSKLIRFRRFPKAFLVLDGQHRLYGYGLTTKKHRIPVSIYVGLTKKEEVSLFIDINTTQRGVPAALLLDIKHLAERESLLEAEFRNLFDYLATEPDSPVHGLLSPSQSARGKIARPTFNRAVGPALKSPVMDQLPSAKRFLLFKNYLKAVEGCLNRPQLLVTSAYFEAFCAVFDEVLRLSRERHSNYKEESLAKILAPIKSIDLASVSSEGKSKITKANILPVLKETISGRIAVDESMV